VNAHARAVALLSGGLDSVVATALWLDGGGQVARCLTFDYGQRASARELDAAARFCRARGLAWQLVALPWLADLARRAGSALARAGHGGSAPSELPEPPDGTAEHPGDAASAAAVWVPARNTVFVAIGAAFAEVDGAAAVIAGFNREEAATFPDNSAAFTAAATALLQHGTRAAVRVASPTQDLDKRGIVAAARRLGLGPGDVWSCYRGEPRPCGRCESCRRSERAWAAG
jgi:7-cyano-7-deazaguanine synthase